MKTAIFAFIPALLCAYLFTPLVLKLAMRFGVIDQPGERRVHERPTPRWGGLAIYLAFIIGVVITVAFHPQIHFDSRVLGVLLGGTVVAIAGMIDDKYDVSPLIQIAAITAGGLVLIAFGVKIAYINNPLDGGINLRLLTIPVTLLWLFGITKTVDLMDGLDGLAAGICAIAAATLLLMTFRPVDELWKMQHPGLVQSFVTVRILSSALLGASLGFLRFNYPPAKIFMGTIGAQFMGFIIASASIVGAFKVAALVAIAVPILVLAVPILDTAFVVLSRALSGRRVYEADKGHVHHRLLDRGLSHGQTIWVIYLLTAILSAGGLAIFWYAK